MSKPNAYSRVARYFKESADLSRMINSGVMSNEDERYLVSKHHHRFKYVRQETFNFLALQGGQVSLHDSVVQSVSEEKEGDLFRTQLSGYCFFYKEGKLPEELPIEIEIMAHSSIKKLQGKEVYALAALPKRGVFGALFHERGSFDTVLTRADSMEIWVGGEIAARHEAKVLDRETPRPATASRPRSRA